MSVIFEHGFRFEVTTPLSSKGAHFLCFPSCLLFLLPFVYLPSYLILYAVKRYFSFFTMNSLTFVVVLVTPTLLLCWTRSLFSFILFYFLPLDAIRCIVIIVVFLMPCFQNLGENGSLQIHFLYYL